MIITSKHCAVGTVGHLCFELQPELFSRGPACGCASAVLTFAAGALSYSNCEVGSVYQRERLCIANPSQTMTEELCVYKEKH